MKQRSASSYVAIASRGSFRIPSDRPLVMFLCGGPDRPADGPDTFDEASLRRLMQRGDGFLISAGARTHFARRWACEYSQPNRLAVIVETEQPFALAWRAFVRQHADPDAPLTLTDFPHPGAAGNLLYAGEIDP